MQGGASARTGAYWVVREGEWRDEEGAPCHERRRGGEAAGLGRAATTPQMAVHGQAATRRRKPSAQP